MSPLRLRALLLPALLALPLALRADPPPSSDPVGALRLRLRANSDTTVSLPLHRPALVETSLHSQSGNQVVLAADIPAIPAEGAYLLVMSGALEGAVLQANSLGGRTLAITNGLFDLGTLRTNALDGPAQGDLVALIPYWTLDTVFPNGAGIQPTTDLLTIKTELLLYNKGTAGTNLAASASYFYFAGDGAYAAGWYRYGDLSTPRGTVRLLPQTYFIVRQPAGTDTELLVTGNLQMAGTRTPISTYITNRAQDNLLTTSLPVPVTLTNSALHESSAFVSTTDLLNIKDQLLIFNNAAVGRNKAASGVYFHFAGDGSFPAGWYRYGDMSQTRGTLVLKPGEGFIIRKASTSVVETKLWHAIPTFLQ